MSGVIRHVEHWLAGLRKTNMCIGKCLMLNNKNICTPDNYLLCWDDYF